MGQIKVETIVIIVRQGTCGNKKCKLKLCRPRVTPQLAVLARGPGAEDMRGTIWTKRIQNKEDTRRTMRAKEIHLHEREVGSLLALRVTVEHACEGEL